MLKRLLPSALVLSAFTAVIAFASGAFAQDATNESRASMPSTNTSSIRLIPVVGTSSFSSTNTVELNHFSGSYSAGLFADFGPGAVSFETGILTLSSQSQVADGNADFHVQTWGIPLLAKFNMSGNPNRTAFLKAGVMPFTASGDASSGFDVMGVGGIGGNIALTANTSLVLDATYNRLFTRDGGLTNYQGIDLLAGLSFNL